jgi:L,D-transpeptidase YcbB
VKNNNRKILLVTLTACLGCLASFTQITTGQLQKFITADKNLLSAEVKSAMQLKEFYSCLNYGTAWVQKENSYNRQVFFDVLQLAADMGLQQKDYQFNYIEGFKKGTVRLHNNEDSLQAEIRITDAALHFYNDIAYGNTKPALGYSGLKNAGDCQSIPFMLANALAKNMLQSLSSHISPALLEVAAIENKIQWFNYVMVQNNFTETIITSNKVNNTNKELVVKLYQLGIIDTVTEKIADTTVKQKLREAQRQFGLLADGVLRTTIMQELNLPLAVRLQQLNLAINYYRWLSCLTQYQPVIVVNIPAAYLKVYRNDDVLLEMRMIVGKKATPTPTLSSMVDEVILYPYWHVPYSIATKELLPAIKRSPAFVDAGNYQILNSAGKIMDPYAMDWHALSRNYFPYSIRQSTGCDNALGLLKLNFYNPFSVYLHDTPNKNLFSMNKRYFSHGCMRLQNPMALGHLVLKNNSIAIDTLSQKGCLRNQAPITVPAPGHLPVIVWYNPAGVDSTGRVLFFEDVYGKFEWMKK